MHVAIVDERDARDARWEAHRPRYRLFVYDGPASAVTAYDITDASLSDVQEAAEQLSHHDERMWALALVVDAGGDGPGLQWLSGMDVHNVPQDASQWRLRREMEDRYLSARVRRSDPPVLPDGRRVIRMFAGWASSPLWESFTDAYLLRPSELGLSDELADALLRWNDRFGARSETDPEPPGWRAEGRALAARLQAELDGVAEVRPELGDP
jgi:hypothetical protein